MSVLPSLPTQDQYQAARAFVSGLERRTSAKGDPAVFGVLASWGRLVDKYLNLVRFAVEAGRLEEASRAWAVVLDVFRPWANSPELPEALRDLVVAAAEAPLNPWGPMAR